MIIGGIGKLISLTCLVGIYGHWFAPIIPAEAESVVIHLHPDSVLLDQITLDINAAEGAGDRLARLIWVRGWEERLKPGRYIVEPGTSINEAAKMFAIGDREAVRVVVPAARDLEVIAGKIAGSIAADSSEVLSIISPDSIRWQIIPNTYEMWWETSAETAVARLRSESTKWWNNSRKEKAAAIGLSPKEVVILASIVQAETANLSEAPKVAGLYLNRLNRGMLLQADPTVIYAIGNPEIRRVLKPDILIDSPYNTYKYKGLPPGTIRTPEPTYIEAVLNAEKHNYIFMCAEPGGTNNHAFATTNAEHNRNARKYHRWLNKQQIYR